MSAQWIAGKDKSDRRKELKRYLTLTPAAQLSCSSFDNICVISQFLKRIFDVFFLFEILLQCFLMGVCRLTQYLREAKIKSAEMEADQLRCDAHPYLFFFPSSSIIFFLFFSPSPYYTRYLSSSNLNLHLYNIMIDPHNIKNGLSNALTIHLTHFLTY